MEFFDVIKERYSCKKFDAQQIDKKQLNAILEAGRLAPTAKKFAGARKSMWYSQRKGWLKSTK